MCRASVLPMEPEAPRIAIRTDIGLSLRAPERSLARGDDLQVAEVAQALGTKLHAKARRLVACERNIRVGVKVLVDPNRPRFKPARDRIQHGRIPTPDRRTKTVRRII